MLDFTGKIVGFVLDNFSNQYQVTFSIDSSNKVLDAIRSLNQKDRMAIHVAKWYPKKSRNANAYLWQLLTQIAAHREIKSTPEEVYLERLLGNPKYLRDECGRIHTALFREDINPNKMAVKSKDIHIYWKPCPKNRVDSGDGWFIVHAAVKGTSLYDAKEMSDMLDDVVAEARSLGIQTETDRDKELLIERWGEEYAKAHKHSDR